MISDPLALAALIAAVAAAAFWLDYRVAPLSRVGASLLAIVIGAVLSNAGLVPVDSTVYDAIGGPVTSLAIAWLLLAVNLSDVRKAGPGMLAAFGLAVGATAVGAFMGALIFAPTFAGDNWKLAGTLTGTYSGGSVNFVAVGRGVGLPDSLFAGATAADNVTTSIWLGATLLLPVWLRRFWPVDIPATARGDDGESPSEARDPNEDHPFFRKRPISTLDLAVLLATGAVLLVLADVLGRSVPAIPSVLWLTTVALLVGQTRPFRTPRGALQLGTVALHLFFVVIGIHSRVADILAVGVEVFFYTLVVVGVHGLLVYGIGRALRLDLGTLSVASQAAVGGPSSALAVAVSRGWRGLVLPGVLVGLLGYALGNYLGFAVGYLVRGLGLGL